jgi:ribonuclease HII
LAGPVAAAAVILPVDSGSVLSDLEGVRDSKRLTARRRGYLCRRIREVAMDWAVGVVHPPIVDVLGIVQATRLAMMQALTQMRLSPDFLLIDYLTLPQANVPQRGIVRGDAKSISIAAASILAKVTRDTLMYDLDSQYPGYGLCSHKGYATWHHKWAIHCHGPSSIHRLSFAPVKFLMGNGGRPQA